MKKSVYNGLYLVVAILLVLPFVLPNSFYLDLVIRMAINLSLIHIYSSFPGSRSAPPTRWPRSASR